MPEGFASFFSNAAGGPGSAGGGPRFQYKFNFSNPEDTFRGAFPGGGGGGGLGADILEELLGGAARAGSATGGSTAGSRASRGMRGSFGAESMRSARAPTPEVTTVERPLPVSLEEMFNGVEKKMKIKRKMFDESGKRTTTDTVLQVPIKPGLKKGSKIRFKGVGDQEEGGQQDLVFIVEEVSLLLLTTPPPIVLENNSNPY